MYDAYVWVTSNATLAPILKGIVVILITVLTLVIGKKLIVTYFNRAVRYKKNVNKLRTVEKIVINMFKMVLLFIATTIFLGDVMAVDTTSILTVAGISGLAVGIGKPDHYKGFCFRHYAAAGGYYYHR